MAGQNDRTLSDAADDSMERSDPVREARRVPVLLLNSMVFRMLALPDALPVFGARVVKPRDE
jgi:hypothetical protein